MKELLERVESPFESEHGFALFYAIVAGLLVFLFVEHGHQILGRYDHPVIYSAVVLILGLVVLFSIGSAVHMKAIGSKPVSTLHEEAVAEAQVLEKLSDECEAMIGDLAPIMANHTGVVSRRAVDCLSVAKKINAALDNRLREVKKLLGTGRRSDIMHAYDLLGQSLTILESRFDTLIDSDPIPPLDPSAIAPTLSQLVQTIHSELRKVA